MFPIRIISVVLLGMLLVCAASSAMALGVKNVRVGIHPDKTRLVIDLTQKADFRVSTIANPPRLVIDMPAFDWQAGAVASPSGSGIGAVSAGAVEAGLSRIIINLDTLMTVQGAFVLPRDGSNSDRLVIDMARASAVAFAQQQGQTRGTLQSGAQVLGQLSSNPASPATARPIPAAYVPPAPSTLPQPAVHTAVMSAVPFTPDAVTPGRKPETDGKPPLVIIDAGHGGVDPGAPGANGMSEKSVTLAMARELKRQLEATGRYRVKLTRDKDEYLRLNQRVSIARAAQGDLFISLHADSIGHSDVRGASIYTLSDKASDAQTERLAAQENRADLIAGVDLSAEDDVVVNILVDLSMRDTMNQSSFLANTVAETLSRNNVRVLENPHRFAGFAVLKAPDIPSILVEMGFMSNRSDSTLLSTPSYQKQLSQALVASVDAYFRQVRRNNRT